jgi:type IV pilus secretin PilQ/predicted competence protein
VQQNQNGSELQLQEDSEIFEEDGLEDFDNGEGEAVDPAAKFEVRRKTKEPDLAWVVLGHFDIGAVGQDTGEDDFDDFSNTEEFALEQDYNQSGNEFAESMDKTAGSENLYSDPNAANPVAPQGDAPIDPVAAPAANAPQMTNPAGMPLNAAPQNAISQSSMPPNSLPQNSMPETNVQEAYPTDQETGSTTYRPENPTERLISTAFKEMPLDYVLKVIMEETKINYIMHPSIEKTPVTIEIHDEPWSLALRAVLETHQLGFIEMSPTMVRIDTLENLDKEKQLLETIRQRALTLTPPKTLVHRLSYAKAEEATKRITELLDATRHGPAKISTDARTNSLVVVAIPTTLAMIQEIIKRLDLPTPQVDIASRIIESTSKSGKSFGIAWGAPISRDAGRGLGFGTLTFPNYVVGDFAVDATTDRQPFQTTMRWGSINDAFELDMALQFGQSQSYVEILQTNNVVVQDNNEAEINTGQIDYIETFAEGGDGLVEINYTLSLKVTPQITSNGMVNMAIAIDSAEPAQVEARNGAAARSTKMIKTLLMKRSGETAVIGGLYTNQRGKSTRGVPFFASIPIIGALFRSDISSVEKREIMIMITPTILANGSTYDQQIQEGSESAPAEFVNAGGNNMFESAAAQNQAMNQQQSVNQGQTEPVQGQNQFQQVQGQNQFQQVQDQNQLQLQQAQGQNQLQQAQGQNQIQQVQGQNQFQQAQGQNVQEVQGQNQFQQAQGQNQVPQENSNEQETSDENEFNFEQ